MKKKIGVLTFFRDKNYGAYLQAFATQYVLSKEHQVVLIDFKRSKWKEQNEISNFSILKKFKYFITNYILHFSGTLDYVNTKRDRLFEEVLNEIPISESIVGKVTTDVGLKMDIDVLLSGSDQVWNANIVGGIDDLSQYYFADVDSSMKKVSYASSMGSYVYTETKLDLMKKWLQGYSHISVREEFAKMQIEKVIDRDIEVVLDPTLLLTINEWTEFENPMKGIPHQYILVYAVGDVQKTLQYAELLAQKKDLPILFITTKIKKEKFVYKNLLSVGPKEFIWLFRNATFIVTSSFHGVAFSVNFNKNFINVYNSHGQQRSSNLLEGIGLKGQVVNKIEDVENVSLTLNYTEPNKLLENWREKSLKYLYHSILE